MYQSPVIEQPTRARSVLLGMIFLLAAITYLDRLSISAAMPSIAKEFDLSLYQRGWIFSAFAITYAAFEIPSGWLGDRFGARLALTRIVIWWSGFTILTGAALGFWSLFWIRALFGAGEAGAFPNVARAVSRWFPPREQGRVMSAAFIGLATGSALTAPVVLLLLKTQHWRWVFVEFGLVGLVWCVAWHRWFRDLPEQHPGVNAAELRAIRIERGPDDQEDGEPRVPWRSLAGSRNLALICLMYFAYGYGLYFYVTWLPTYLIEARGFSLRSTMWFSALPWVISIPGFWFSGWITDRLARTGNLKLARCGVGAAGYLASAVTLVVAAQIADRVVSATLLAVALCFQTVTVSAAWAVCLDVGRKYAGVVTGFMNTIGNIGGALAPIAFGHLVKDFGSWIWPFYLMAAVLAFGAVMWTLVDPHRSVLEEV